MFVWRARTFLDQLEALQPKTPRCECWIGCRAVPTLRDLSGATQDQRRLCRDGTGLARRGSARVVAVRLPITWHDVGGFAALSEQLPRDERGNAIHGVSVLVDARDNLVINNTEDGRVVAVVGLTDTVIVQTPQITLVCPISEAERIKELVAEVTAKLGGGYA